MLQNYTGLERFFFFLTAGAVGLLLVLLVSFLFDMISLDGDPFPKPEDDDADHDPRFDPPRCV